MKIGDLKIYPIIDTDIFLDGGAMFGVVPRVIWQKRYVPDEKNRIRLSLHCPLIVTRNHTILVDTGVGTKHEEKFCQIYGIDKKTSLLQSLLQFGFVPDDVDMVVNTHLHFDHAGGNTTFHENGKIIPAFPRAKYFIQQGEIDVALANNERTKASYMTEDFLPIEEYRLLQPVNDEITEIDKGVTLVKVGGHTKHFQCVKIESEGQTAFFLGDLIPTTAHLRYPYLAAYDLYPLETLEKKKEVLQTAFEEHWLLIFQHDPDLKMGYLKKYNNGFSIEEVKTG